jgi:Putative transposase
LSTVYRAISGFLLQKAGLTRATGFPGAVTLIQRFGSALNLNIHFHSITVDRLALTSAGQVRCTLKPPYRDGTTHSVLEPLDPMVRLAALVPPPRMHLTRFHGLSRAGTWLMKCSLIAVIVSDGFTPGFAGMVEPSHTRKLR